MTTHTAWFPAATPQPGPVRRRREQESRPYCRPRTCTSAAAADSRILTQPSTTRVTARRSPEEARCLRQLREIRACGVNHSSRTSQSQPPHLHVGRYKLSQRTHTENFRSHERGCLGELVLSSIARSCKGFSPGCVVCLPRPLLPFLPLVPSVMGHVHRSTCLCLPVASSR